MVFPIAAVHSESILNVKLVNKTAENGGIIRKNIKETSVYLNRGYSRLSRSLKDKNFFYLMPFVTLS